MIMGGGSIVESAAVLASAFSVGMVVGLIGGLLWLPMLKKYDKIEFSYVITLAMLFLLYAGVETVGGSGAIACLMFGVVLANGKAIMSMLRYGRSAFELSDDTKSLHSLMSFLVRTFFFVYLGLLVSLTNWIFIMIGVILVIVTMAARVSAVHLTMPKDFSLFDKRLMYVMLPRGLAAAVLANLVVTRGVPGTVGFMDIVFTVIIGTVLVTTIGVFVMGHSGKEVAEKEEIKTAKKEAEEAQRKAEAAAKEAAKRAEEIKKQAKQKAEKVAKEADKAAEEVAKKAEKEAKKEAKIVKKIESKKRKKPVTSRSK
jgi:NhaP-type Na+/H+ or K+/H+ antiporter